MLVLQEVKLGPLFGTIFLLGYLFGTVVNSWGGGIVMTYIVAILTAAVSALFSNI